MPDPTDLPSPTPFIPQNLRPFVGVPADGPAPLGPNATRAEVEGRAVKALGALLGKRYAAAKENAAPLSSEGRYRPAPNVAATEVDGEAVLLNLQTGQYFSLNRVGTAIWQHLEKAQPLGTSRDALCACFDVSAEVAWKDMTGFVNHLKRERLVVEVSQE